ncbi:MAG: ribosome biogenesis GTPase Der [Flavobacteriales bacterium]
MKKIFAIVGRPNVGKSTLFNKLTESRDAIVDETSGVTRDRKYGEVYWSGREFSIIDTGGFIKDGSDIFEERIVEQVELALEECDAIIFMVDAVTGLTDLDLQFADILRRQEKDIIVVSNKVDTSNKEYLSAEIYSLGFKGEVHSISANNGYGTGDLLDKLIEYVPNVEEDEKSSIPSISVVGKPNVGKSSLINSLTGTERFIVSDVSGTTRDSADLVYNQFGYNIRLVDTAGLRRAKSINDDLEFYSTLRTRRAIANSDVCILLIDAVEGVTKQDLAIFFEILRAKKAVVIGVNKWDVLEKSNHSYTEFKRSILEQIQPFTDVNIEFISAQSKQRIHKLLDLALEVNENRSRRIPTSKVNDVLLEQIEAYPPPAIKGKYIRIKFVRQIPTQSPAFAFYCNLPQYIKDPYKRYLENKIRESFNFTGVPIDLFFRKK